MSRWTLYSTLLLLVTSVGCSGLVGQRYAGSEVAPSGRLLHGHFATSQHVQYADYTEADHGDCASCSAGHLTTTVPRVSHSCETCDSGVTHCDRCEGGTVVPWRSTKGMPILQRLQSHLVCGDGCGEVYIGEWISTPPTPDPCDTCGNYTGVCNHMSQRPHHQPVRTTLRLARGVRYAAFGCGGCGEVGCDLCDESVAEYQDSVAIPYSPEFLDAGQVESAHMHAPHTAAKPSCNCGGH